MKYDYYSQDVLRKLQKIELSILKEFDEICDEYGLDYFLVGGSAIGAVRHQGFIPWDDDIDVGMSRKDYNLFLKIALEKYEHKYTVMNNESNHNFPLMNTRWGLKGTEYKTEDLKDVDGSFGIFLDIFCFDNIPDDQKEMKRQATSAWFWGKFLVLSGVKKPVLYFDGVKAKILQFIFFIAHYVLKVLHLKPSFFYKKALKYALQYEHDDTSRFAYMFDPSRYTSIIKKSDVYPTKKMKFENIEARVPNRIEAYLTTRYENYMQLPPEDKRHIHPPYNLDLGIFDKERSV